MFRELKYSTFESTRDLVRFVNNGRKIVVSIVKNTESFTVFYYEP